MTVKELAALAGVSPATVSLVLNGKKGVSEEKRKEILKLVEDNRYRHQKRNDAGTRNILFIKYSRDGVILEENTNFVSAIMDGAVSWEGERRDGVGAVTAAGFDRVSGGDGRRGWICPVWRRRGLRRWDVWGGEGEAVSGDSFQR